jgi:hypothetical protein
MTQRNDTSPAERFITPCELPTAHEREILTILIEEAAEVQQRATKLLRFGRDEIQPGQTLTNAERLSLEIADFLALVDLAKLAGLADAKTIYYGTIAKKTKLQTVMQTVAARGATA